VIMALGRGDHDGLPGLTDGVRLRDRCPRRPDCFRERRCGGAIAALDDEGLGVASGKAIAARDDEDRERRPLPGTPGTVPRDARDRSPGAAGGGAAAAMAHRGAFSQALRPDARGR
jgi:hypothetical protein